MALRTREARVVRGIVDQENVKNVIKGKTRPVVGASRTALDDVTQAINKLKDVGLANRKPFSKPALESQKAKVITKPAAQKPISKSYKPPAKEASVKPLLTERTLGLQRKADEVLSEPKPIEKPVAVIQPNVRLDNVFDIDKEDIDKPYLVPEYANDIYAYLHQLENKYSIRENFLSDQKITARMRATLIDWLVEVQQQYHLLSETLHLSVAILDMFLQKVKTITRDSLQLVGISAMFVACKYEETYSPDLSDFVYITDNSFSKEDVLAMERHICDKLDFGLGRPLSLHFLRRCSKAAKATPTQHTIAKYFLELALVEYQLAHVKPSLVAASACYISLFVTSTQSKELLWTNTLITYSTYQLKDLKPLLPVMVTTIVTARTSKLQLIYKKYSSSQFQKVSLLPALESEDLRNLAGLS